MRSSHSRHSRHSRHSSHCKKTEERGNVVGKGTDFCFTGKSGDGAAQRIREAARNNASSGATQWSNGAKPWVTLGLGSKKKLVAVKWGNFNHPKAPNTLRGVAFVPGRGLCKAEGPTMGFNTFQRPRPPPLPEKQPVLSLLPLAMQKKLNFVPL